MQFACEQCKATLHIADDKVKGKRLVVRCKKCGNRITISDPALGAAPAAPALAAPAPVAAPVAARPAPKPEPKPAPAPAAEPEGEAHDSDTDDTRAMDSDVLEQALRASKVDDSAGGFAPLSLEPATAKAAPRPAPAPVRAAVAPPPAEPPIAHRDPAIWFAMVGGKQTGPMNRAELAMKTAQGTTTARTYVWKEGMGAWLRAKEVPELSTLFAEPPAKPEPKPAPPPPPAAKKAPEPKPAPVVALKDTHGAGLREFGTQDFGDLKLPVHSSGPDGAGALGTGGFGAVDLSAERSSSAGASGISLALDGPVSLGAPAAGKSAQAHAEPSALSIDGLPKLKVGADSEWEERTNVEALPLGERVHQESVAKELFTSGEDKDVSAVDLAKWASSELSKKGLSSSPALKKSPPPTATPAPGGKAVPAATAKADDFSGVPEMPGLKAHDPKDRTGDIIAKSGVQKSRTGLLVGGIGAGVLVLLGLVWSLSGDEEKAAPPPVETAAKPSLGGSGDANVGALAKNTEAPPAPKAEAPPAPAVPSSTATKKAAKAATPTLTQDQEAAMKGLDNERGIGNHGPKAEAAAAPPPERPEGLTADDIKKKLGENRGALQSCIDEALRKNPDLKVGKIRVNTAIAPSGQVTAVKIDKKNVDESALGACLKKVTKRIVFPSFAGEAFEVDIPIVVTAGE